MLFMVIETFEDDDMLPVASAETREVVRPFLSSPTDA